ncbi:hypothetical protein ABGB07_29105 [Micromonosporaceae bacterium B7E4]
MQPDWEHEYVEFVTTAMPRMRRLAYLLCGDAHRADGIAVRDGTAVQVSRLREDGTGSSYATGLGDDGTLVGGMLRFGTDQVVRMMVWAPDGTVRTLAPPPRHGVTTGYLSIRDGWVLGWSVAPPGAEQKVVPTRWNVRTAEATPLTGLAWAAAINRYGWVAGVVRDATGVETPAVLAGERPVVLPLPDGAVPGRAGPAAVSVSDDGRVVGGLVSVGPDDATAAVRWTCE